MIIIMDIELSSWKIKSKYNLSFRVLSIQWVSTRWETKRDRERDRVAKRWLIEMNSKQVSWRWVERERKKKLKETKRERKSESQWRIRRKEDKEDEKYKKKSWRDQATHRERMRLSLTHSSSS